MPKDENMNCELSASITRLYTFGIISEKERDKARKRLGTVKEQLTVGPPTKPYKFNDSCFCCGALPVDQINNPWGTLPWIVTLRESGNQRFLIDRRDLQNSDMFSGYRINGCGSIGDGKSLTTGAGGRLNLHRTYFNEEIPI